MKRALVAIVLAGCDAASPDPGLTAKLQVAGAQFRPGAFPADEGGPTVAALTTRHSMIVVDRLSEPLRGILAPEARAAAVGVAGSDDAWIIVAGPADLETPGQPTARGTFGVAADFPRGPFELQIAAADEDGRFGAPLTTTITALDEDPPAGTLVVGLVWDGKADLDLHVVDPLGGEAWSDDPNTAPPPAPGDPVDPDVVARGGKLDRDGNKDCHRDGRPREHVIWDVPPPSGEFIVRVDTRAMCGDPIASWYAFAMQDGVIVAQACGLSTPADVVFDIDELGRAGAGVLAFRFRVP